MTERDALIVESINALLHVIVMDWAMAGRPNQWDMSSDNLRTFDWLLAELS